MAPRSKTSLRRWIFPLALLAVLLAGSLRFLHLQSRSAEATAPPAARSDGDREPAALATPAAAPEASRAAVAAESAVETSSPASAPEVEAPAPAAAAAVADLNAKRAFLVRVVNEEGVGIADAVVKIRGMRSSASEGSWYGYRGDEPGATTDRDGNADLAHWAWVDQDGSTIAVDLIVEHPEYAPFHDSSLDLKDERHLITLKRGSTVVVSGWTGTPENRVRGIDVQSDSRSGVKEADWQELPDGSKMTSQLAPGPHYLRVSHESE